MSEAQQSDALKNLVIFCIALAIIGIILALILYYTGWVPVAQAALHAPENWSLEGYEDDIPAWAFGPD